MKNIDLIDKIQSLGVNNKDVSIQLSNPYAHFHFNKGIGKEWEVYYKGDRGEIKFKKVFTDENVAKEYFVDFISVMKGGKTIYNVIDSFQKFEDKKSEVLKGLKSNRSNNNKLELQKLNEFILKFDYKNPCSMKDKIEEFLIDNSLLLGDDISQEIMFFVNSVKGK